VTALLRSEADAGTPVGSTGGSVSDPRTIHAGREKITIPRAWTAFVWHARTYRIAGPQIEVYDRLRGAWLPSIRLTTSAPRGREL
jgi:hypothetical protein